MKVQERFLHYISYWTTSDPASHTTPSTKREFALAEVLKQELTDLGCIDVKLDDKCYVYALLPATKGYESYKSIGFISHMDTSPDASGENINPQIIPHYDGKDILLPATNDLIRVKDFPTLSSLKGRTLITSDGSTLLGADDKAGIAEILTALEELISEHTPHGDIRIAFTPDEELGTSADYFDLSSFPADYAYTVDGDYEGEIAYENFNAASAKFTIHGVSVHPGSAKNIMKNAAAIACELQCMLPQEQTPEHTENREGFIHLHEIKGDVTQTELHYILRDHDQHKFQTKKDLLLSITNFLNQKYGNETVSLTITDEYQNMFHILKEYPFIIQQAQSAIRSTSIPLISTPIRGGTDGARLSYMGLPCPNLGTGGYAFHGPYEHISVEGMVYAVKIIKYLMAHPINSNTQEG